jgi:hypothetical protein
MTIQVGDVVLVRYRVTEVMMNGSLLRGVSVDDNGRELQKPAVIPAEAVELGHETDPGV